jgi:hypothetical protein
MTKGKDVAPCANCMLVGIFIITSSVPVFVTCEMPTANPPEGAGRSSVTVRVVWAPAVMEEGVTVMDVIFGSDGFVVGLLGGCRNSAGHVG